MSDDHLHTVGSLHDGKISLDDFTLIKVIGKGTYGKVMLVRHKKVCLILGDSVSFSFFSGQRGVCDEDVAERARCEAQPSGAH
jgi:serine/threonine protein kinase